MNVSSLIQTIALKAFRFIRRYVGYVKLNMSKCLYTHLSVYIASIQASRWLNSPFLKLKEKCFAVSDANLT